MDRRRPRTPNMAPRAAAICRGNIARRNYMKIIVIGGTGLIGSKVVKNLRERGHTAVAASPATGAFCRRHRPAFAKRDSGVPYTIVHSTQFFARSDVARAWDDHRLAVQCAVRVE
ncbi:NAD-dependent epimerase/dehydratase family protein [Paraburkholderia sp. BR14374]|uniref:NAD-dependent epimerase/dehydratase family protein n=1 Tax=Paraburkholderia sp. BR14374 TaxID=3237007 RepID=UPI0034CE6963